MAALQDWCGHPAKLERQHLRLCGTPPLSLVWPKRILLDTDTGVASAVFILNTLLILQDIEEISRPPGRMEVQIFGKYRGLSALLLPRPRIYRNGVA